MMSKLSKLFIKSINLKEKINDNIKDNKSGLEKVYDTEYDEFIETLKKHKVKE